MVQMDDVDIIVTNVPCIPQIEPHVSRQTMKGSKELNKAHFQLNDGRDSFKRKS